MKFTYPQGLLVLIALSSVAGCQTGSVKGQVKTIDALSILLPDTSIAPTELKVKVDAVVKTVGVDLTSEDFNASGKFEVKDSNLDREYKGNISFGLIGNDVGPTPGNLTTQVSSSVAGLAQGLNELLPNFVGVGALSNTGASSLTAAAFLGSLKVEDGEDGDDGDDGDENEPGIFIALVLDFPSIPVSPTQSLSTIVGFAALTQNNAYIAVGVSNESKLKWKIKQSLIN